jgi:TonB family protein
VNDIFISYAKEDRERARRLAEALTTAGNWSVFWDRSIPPGLSWFDVIGKELEEARCIVAAWSHPSVQSDWVREEADEGKKRKILIPVFLDQVAPPVGFRAIQGVDLSNWEGSPGVPEFQLLLTAVKRILGADKEAARRAHEQANADQKAGDQAKIARDFREQEAAAAARREQERQEAERKIKAEKEAEEIARRERQETEAVRRQREQVDRKAKKTGLPPRERDGATTEHKPDRQGVSIGRRVGEFAQRNRRYALGLAVLGLTVALGGYLLIVPVDPMGTALPPPPADFTPRQDLQFLAPPPPPPPTAPPAETSAAGPSPVRVGGVIKMPRKVVDVPPIYPPIAQAAGVSGTVILEATVAKDGSVKDARVLRSIPLLDQSAVNAVAQWKYTPTLVQGQPVELILTVIVPFKLQ